MRECTPVARSVVSLGMLLIGVLSTGLVGQVVVQTDGARAQSGESPTGEGHGRSITTQPATSQPGETGEGLRPPWLPKGPGPWDAALCVVRSKDGLTFKPAPKPVIRFADAPTLARLSDGRLMAVFEHYPRTDRRLFGTLASAQSTDDGKTWSEPRPLKIKGLPRRAGPPGGPALAVGPDRCLRLTFVCRDRKNRRTIFVARSKDGEVFKLAGRLDLVEEDLSIDDPAVLYIDKISHLFGTVLGVAGQRYHGTSQTGRRFERQASLHTAEVGTQGCVIAAGDDYRFYATSPAGIMSANSADSNHWSRDHGLRMPGVSDPAVIRLEDDSYVMMYVQSPPGARGKARIQRDGDAPAAEADVDPVGAGEVAEVDDLLGNRVTPDDPDAGAAEEPYAEEAYAEALDDLWYQDEPGLSDETGEFLDGPETAWEDDLAEWADDDEAEDLSEEGDISPDDDPSAAPDPNAAEDEPDKTLDQDADEALLTDEDLTGEQDDYYEPEYTDGGVPVPDFIHRVDYRTWLEQRRDPESVEDNAAEHYAPLMPYLNEDGEMDSPVPALDNMFTDPDHQGPPGPWDPEEHPAWEESHYQAEEFVAQFAEAAAIENCVRPVIFPEPKAQADDATDADGSASDVPRDPLLDDLLINIMLPDLSTHRKLVRQSLSDAWRSPQGEPDPQAVLDAFETSLGSAGHLAQGETLIEMLVGSSEKKMVQDNARWALQHEVFSPDEMQAALDLLIEKDLSLDELSNWSAGELAFSMDATQYLFGPVQEGREPALNPQRIEQFGRLFDLPDMLTEQSTPEEIASTTAEQVIENFIGFYRRYNEMATQGYPAVKARDLDEMTELYVQDNPLSRVFLPSLSRVYQLATRQEASRRATQLTYAIHLHQAETGQWPDSLDDLPPRYTETARTDPFSGGDFVYRLTDDGFTLYSTSENGEDDGGGHHRHWGDRNKDDETDDYLFWPPQHR